MVAEAAALIREYYRRIDAGDLDWVLGLFSPGAVYVRAGETYRGAPAIAAFYHEERRIQGTHVLAMVLAQERTVVVQGTFSGVGAAGDPRRVDFCDLWDLDRGGRVRRRQTYLSLGADYVRR